MLLAGEQAQAIVNGEMTTVTVIDMPDESTYTVQVDSTGELLDVDTGALAQLT